MKRNADIGLLTDPSKEKSVTQGKSTESKRRIPWGRYLLVLFIAAWMFVLGVLVGRGTAPVHFDTRALQKELASLRDAMMKKEREAVEKAIRGEGKKEPLEFYEALKKDGPDTTVRIPAAPVSAGGAPVPGKTAKAMEVPHKSRSATMVKKSGAKVRQMPVAAPSKPRPPVAEAGNLTIQVASLKDAAAAQRIVANLKQDGYPAYLSRIIIADKGLWFRVRVGSYKDRPQAAADMKRLRRDRKKPILVKK